MENKRWNQMASIQSTFERCQAEGIGLSRNFIRTAVLTGQIPSVLTGNRTRLINWSHLMTFIENGTPTKEETHEPGVIRRIEAR
jgi:hypothetical protein